MPIVLTRNWRFSKTINILLVQYIVRDMGFGKKIPDRWEEYGSIGKRIEGTRFITFKVPLKEALCRQLPAEAKFTPADLLEQTRSSGLHLGMVIDLTNTTRYYDPKVFRDADIEYRKIFTEGRVVPSMEVKMDFMSTVDDFIERNQKEDVLIGVHCTHGLNRTGHLVCRYMIDRLNMQPDNAITAYNEARGHEMERENYIEDLRTCPTDMLEYENYRTSKPVAPEISDYSEQGYSQHSADQGDWPKGRYFNDDSEKKVEHDRGASSNRQQRQHRGSRGGWGPRNDRQPWNHRGSRHGWSQDNDRQMGNQRGSRRGWSQDNDRQMGNQRGSRHRWSQDNDRQQWDQHHDGQGRDFSNDHRVPSAGPGSGWSLDSDGPQSRRGSTNSRRGPGSGWSLDSDGPQSRRGSTNSRRGPGSGWSLSSDRQDTSRNGAGFQSHEDSGYEEDFRSNTYKRRGRGRGSGWSLPDDRQFSDHRDFRSHGDYKPRNKQEGRDSMDSTRDGFRVESNDYDHSMPGSSRGGHYKRHRPYGQKRQKSWEQDE